MAGYHVHEKAILMVILPLTLGAVNSRAAARSFLMLSMTGHYALLPLLFTKNEYPLKVSPPFHPPCQPGVLLCCPTLFAREKPTILFALNTVLKPECIARRTFFEAWVALISLVGLCVQMLILVISSLASCALLRKCGQDPVREDGVSKKSTVGDPGLRRSLIRLLGGLNCVYLLGLVGVELLSVAVCPLLLPRLPFLPLMLRSVYCAAGLTRDWQFLYWQVQHTG